MKKSNIFNVVKEVACDALLVLFVLFILVFPFTLVWFFMWVQNIIFG